jgi:hypothetical protein
MLDVHDFLLDGLRKFRAVVMKKADGFIEPVGL